MRKSINESGADAIELASRRRRGGHDSATRRNALVCALGLASNAALTSHMAWAPGQTTVARRASRTSALTGCHPAPSSARCFLAISDFMASTMRSAVLTCVEIKFRAAHAIDATLSP